MNYLDDYILCESLSCNEIFVTFWILISVNIEYIEYFETKIIQPKFFIEKNQDLIEYLFRVFSCFHFPSSSKGSFKMIDNLIIFSVFNGAHVFYYTLWSILIETTMPFWRQLYYFSVELSKPKTEIFQLLFIQIQYKNENVYIRRYHYISSLN